MNAACFAGSKLREIAVGLRCSMPMRCRAISPERVWYSTPHSRAIHAPTARVVGGRVSASSAAEPALAKASLSRGQACVHQHAVCISLPTGRGRGGAVLWWGTSPHYGPRI